MLHCSGRGVQFVSNLGRLSRDCPAFPASEIDRENTGGENPDDVPHEFDELAVCLLIILRFPSFQNAVGFQNF